MTASAPLLAIDDLWSGYGSSMVLQGVTLEIPAGHVVAVLGRNGMGKTTLVHTVMGLIRPRRGSIRVDGEEVAGLAAHAIARRGVGLVPQGRRIFARLSVEENLRIAERSGDGWDVDRVFTMLPQLAARRNNRGHQLSGGEQQMLAIARGLVGNPRLLLLDEPSEGLAPRVVDGITEILAGLREGGLSALLVEPNLKAAFELADQIHIMTGGKIVYRADVEEFRRDPATARSLLGVS